MLTMVKLARNGNGTTVGIPRAVLQHLNWRPGDHVVMVVNENGTITLQRVTAEDLRIAAQRHLPIAESITVTP